MSGAGHEDIRHHVKTYIGVFVALMVFTVITVAVASLNLALGMAIAVAMVVATVKGSLVAAYFMHLKSERPFIFWVLIITLIFWVHLIFIPVLMYLDSYGVDYAVR